MSISMTEADKKAFREMVPLSSVPQEQFEQLCEKCGVECGAPGTTLFHQGEPNNAFFFLLKGKVSLAIGDVLIETVAAGSPTARFALAHQVPRKVTATALTGIRFIRIENDLLRGGDRERSLRDGAARPDIEWRSIVDLLLPDRQLGSGRLSGVRNQGSKLSGFKRIFRWPHRRSPGPNADRPSQMDPSVPTGSDDGLHGGPEHQQVTEMNREAVHLPDNPSPAHATGESSTSEKSWKRNLPREIENQLQALLISLMRDVSDISGSLVTTARGTFLSSEFPEHRVDRIQAIVRAAIASDQNETSGYADDAPEEILVRERNSLMLIFLIDDQGLLALNANISANLGLIRLEARPVVIQVRDILSQETEQALGP